MKNKFPLLLAAVLLLNSATGFAQKVPSPKEHFGFNIGDDYQLANYTQTEAYFKKLEASDRVKLVDIGLTEEGRHQYMIIVSSPKNMKELDKYKSISQQLAHAEGLTDDQARSLAETGKAVVWIDGGLHATEVVGTHQLIETAYQLISRTDAETMRILDNVIILFTHANPDGQELVSNWYMRNSDPLKRSTELLPVLYEKYAGHDNNRDFYMMNLKESTNMGKQLYIEWIPQIMYNHHQRGPEGSVLAGPPYRDPFSFFFDPLLVTGIDALGAAMINRLNAENKPGFTRLNGSSFSTWYNGGLRTTSQFHNQIGLLTEIIGNPTPEKIPVVPQRLIPNGATPFPVLPNDDWRFQRSIDYSVSLNYAILNYAARQRDEVLFNIYRMGKNAIERGSKDTWTLSPKTSDSITQAFRRDQDAKGVKRPEDDGSDPYGWRRRGNNIPQGFYDGVLKNPANRDARGYIIPADQPDFGTAVKFINTLVKTGIAIEKATTSFTVAGKQYPAGSYIVKAAQAFRPHVLDMFEPQDHPNDFQYPGGPPIRPYDAAGWTLAFQMGVEFDRIMDGFEGPFQKLPYGELQSPPKQTIAANAGAGYLLSPHENNAFLAVNDLLKAGVKVFRTTTGSAGIAQGTFFVPAGAKAKEVLQEVGLKTATAKKRPANTVSVNQMRIALWDTYGGSMPSGWMRFIMEQFHFPYTVIYPKDIDAGNLNSKYDVIIFPTRAIPALAGRENPAGNSGFTPREPKEEETPEQYRASIGKITPEKSIPELQKFLEAGGSVVTIGSSTSLAYHLKLPVSNYLVEKDKEGKERPLPGTKYFVPGSILHVSIDSTLADTWGMPAEGNVNFDNSPVFKLEADAAGKGIKPIAWFSTDHPLRSGWAFGQAYLKDGVAAFIAPVGTGKLYAFGPEITFRGQSHSTFKLLFNGLYNLDIKPSLSNDKK
ncbi:M14 family metallopeptidase [Chitinophaga niabensis]|uniref:Zinc carboxypeptidase n=1 Tax=Chitinophaga niabensis TaxID=536979 RepID=A0A1N6FLJ4_9BACT|nr:M14 metallopeptidase family protein [Chitinophaga niabensis]SIN96070.1 Zinc carboxypeptidase [Chitinophaga niabensis]